MIRWLLFLMLLWLAGCARLPVNPALPEQAFTDTTDTPLARAWAAAPQSREGLNAFQLLDNGLDAFVARAALAEVARRGIDLQYYMIHDDHVGTLLLDRLLAAADRGVRVRILLDDIDEGHRDFNIAVFAYHPNIEVRLFNPFGRNTARIWQFVTGFGRQTRRAHNKSFTVDGYATIVGGRNIGDEYFERDPELAFQDLDLLAIGPLAGDVEASFDEYWNHPLSYPVEALAGRPATAADFERLRQELAHKMAAMADSEYLERLRSSELAARLRSGRLDFVWGRGRVLADHPDKLRRATDDTSTWLMPALEPWLAGASRELILVSPYFVPGRQGVARLKALATRGVKVRVLTNSLASTDVTIVHAGYRRYREALLRAGVELWELNDVTTKHARKGLGGGYAGKSRHSLHAKAMVVDRRVAFIGSLNLDPRSVVQNTEIGVLVKAPELARVLAEGIDRSLSEAAFLLRLEFDEHGRQRLVWLRREGNRVIRETSEPHVALWRRILVRLLGWLPIESQI